MFVWLLSWISFVVVFPVMCGLLLYFRSSLGCIDLPSVALHWWVSQPSQSLTSSWRVRLDELQEETSNSACMFALLAKSSRSANGERIIPCHSSFGCMNSSLRVSGGFNIPRNMLRYSNLPLGTLLLCFIIYVFIFGILILLLHILINEAAFDCSDVKQLSLVIFSQSLGQVAGAGGRGQGCLFPAEWVLSWETNDWFCIGCSRQLPDGWNQENDLIMRFLGALQTNQIYPLQGLQVFPTTGIKGFWFFNSTVELGAIKGKNSF